MNSDFPEVLAAQPAGICKAARLLSEGQLVAFPTETVYGLGADARSDRAVRAIYAAKGRPANNPLIVHVADLDRAREIAFLGAAAEQLARMFWPGALTLVLPVRPDAGLAAPLMAGLETVAVRVPAHPVAAELLKVFCGPVAAPSANPSGRISPTTAAHVVDGMGGRVAAVLDGGPTEVGLESTILDLSGPGAVLLREGGIPRERIEDAVGPLAAATSPTAAPKAPGQLASHYAPKAAVRLNATKASAGELLLGFGPVAGDVSLSPIGDLDEAARNLFACLHHLDDLDKPIAVAPIPEDGIGRAINDRLRRAAAPRD
ncbi:MAG: L-threonylcarbamoyladenylate synthase [Pseudomonadota bacterium]